MHSKAWYLFDSSAAIEGKQGKQREGEDVSDRA